MRILAQWLSRGSNTSLHNQLFSHRQRRVARRRWRIEWRGRFTRPKPAAGATGAVGFPRLHHSRLSRTLKGMEVHFTPEQESQLSQIASHAGTDAERLVKDAALRLLEEEARFRAAVREGIAQANRGELIEEEEMDARLEQMLRS